MSHRRSPASVAAAAKASWDTVDASKHHHGDGGVVTSGQGASPTSGIFKQRRAIGRHSALSTAPSAPRRPPHNDVISDDKVTSNRRGKCPPSMVNRPRSSTGFEDYFADIDASAKLRSLKTKPSLQELKKLTLWEQKHPDISPRDKRCASSLELNLHSELDGEKELKSKRISAGRSQYHHHRQKEGKDRHEEINNDGLDFTDKIKAFHALVSPSPKSRRESPSQRDISNEQLKRARSFSSGIEEVGGYVRFSSQSSENHGMRASTPLNIGDETGDDFKDDAFEKTSTFDKTSRSSQFVENNHANDMNLKHFESNQRRNLPPDYRGGNLREFEDVQNQIFSKTDTLRSRKIDGTVRNLSSDVTQRSIKEGIYIDTDYNGGSDRVNKERLHRYDASIHEKTQESGLNSQRRRGETKRIIRRSPQTVEEHVRESGMTRTTTKSRGEARENPRSNYADSTASVRGQSSDREAALVDREVLEYMRQTGERRRRRDEITSSNQDRDRDHRSQSAAADTKRSLRADQRPASSLECQPRQGDGGTALGTSRPLSTTGFPNGSQHSYNARPENRIRSSSSIQNLHCGTTKIDVGPVTKSNIALSRQGSKEDGLHRHSSLAKDASLKTHLNILGASLSSLSSRLTSSSESDLRSQSNGRSEDIVTSAGHGVRSACATAGAGGAAEMLSSDSSISASKRQIGGGRSASPFDSADVRISLREDGLNLQTWASSSSLVSGTAVDSDRADACSRHHPGHSAVTAVRGADHSNLSDTSSCEIGSPYDGRQTNVDVVLEEGCLSSRTESSGTYSSHGMREQGTSRKNNLMEFQTRERTENYNASKERKIQRNLRKHAGSLTSDQNSEVLVSNSQSAKTSNTLESSNQTLADSELSEHSLDATIVSTGATESQVDRESNLNSPKQRHDSRYDGNKAGRPKIISRKNPLRAVHPVSQDSKDVTDENRQSRQNHKSPDGATRSKEKHILVRRPVENRHDQTSQSKEGQNSSNLKFMSEIDSLKASVESLASNRSKSSLGLFSSVSSNRSLLNSPLPSKANMKNITDKTRPQTSLAVSGYVSSSKTKAQRQSKSKTPEVKAEGAGVTKAGLLKQKVQRLHDDISRRLQSRPNSSYSINSSYEHRVGDEQIRLKIKNGRDADDAFDESESYLSDASTIQKVDSPDGDTLQQSPRSHHRQRSPRLHSTVSSPLSSPKPGFATSTPVKGERQSDKGELSASDTESKRRLLRRVVRELSKESINGEVEKETDTAQRQVYGRYTPDLTRGGKSRYGSGKGNLLMRLQSRDEDSASDDDDGDLKGQGDTKYGLRRSESMGSLLRSKVNRQDDFMGRILDKMSGLSKGQGRQNSLKDVNGISTWHARSSVMYADSDNRLSGRASPADMLLGHLDNPQMVNLLQRLYKADPDTRKILMVKFQYFKAWECYTKESKEKRTRKEELADKGEFHLRYRLLCLHFVVWWQRANHCAQVRQADALLRRHTLSKGLKALRWSLSQSRHTEARVQSNVRSAVIKKAFSKWKTRAVRHRLDRKQAALARWKQFVTETKKIRHMRQLMDSNIQQDVLRTWHKRYRKRTKLNMAFSFFRHSLSRKALGLWKLYVLQCKLAQEKLTSAVAKHQRTMLNNAFYSMLVSYKKTKKAKAHFRAYKLSETLWAWREAAQVCRGERLRDLAASTEHWRCARLRQGFSQWREALQVRRLNRLAQAHLCRAVFTLWFVAWQRNIEQREAIQETLTRDMLRGALLSWRQNVVRLRMRQKKAVVILEHCHLKQTFKCWRLYTARRGILKKKVLIHNIQKSKEIICSSFAIWQDAYSYRREQERRKQLWSSECARKFAAQWRLTCRKRKLRRLHLEVLRPVRETRMLQAMFGHWVFSLESRHVEAEKAEEMKERVERSRLKACFLLWQGETNRALLLKPLQQRREQRNLAESLKAWRNYVAGRSQCRANYELFKMKVIKSSFEAWRRHYQACQVARQVSSRASQGLVLCCLHAWRFLIDRKRKSREFRQSRLVKVMFLAWKGRASFEMDRRARLEQEEASNQSLKQRCFYLWRENSRAQAARTGRRVQGFTQRQQENRLCRAFLDWRRHMHSTLVSRAYQKSLGERMMATLFCEWRTVTSCIVDNAVHAFSERIGLRDHVTDGYWAESGIGLPEDNESDSEEAMTRSVASYSSTFSVGSSARRLFGETSSFDTDTDRLVLLSGGLQASVNDHQLKCQRLKEMSTLAIIRLTNWPVCVAFEQWREFTERERQLKEAAAQLRTRVARLEEARAFRIWRDSYRGASMARKHRALHLTQVSFQSLRAYRNHRKYVKSLNHHAQSHCILVTGRKFFYPWLTRAQDQRKQKHILHLWSSRTEQEMQLLPLETQMTNQISRRSLFVCFSVWLVRYRAVSSIRNVMNSSLLSWVFTAWRNWAEMRHDLTTKSREFLDIRRKKLAFSRWRERLIQTREVEQRHQLAWTSYLRIIFQQWHIWATSSKQLALLKREVSAGVCRRQMVASFWRWRSMAAKVRSARSSKSQRLTHSFFVAWRRETIRKREEKSRVLQCQVRSYTLLVERLFHQWCSVLHSRQQERQERQLLAENQARHWAQVWRRRAQTSRGQWLQARLDRRKMAAAFGQWSVRLDHVHHLHSLLELHQRQRGAELLERSLQTWRLQLSSARAVRLRQCRLLVTVMLEWRVFTKESKDRRIRGMALKKALQERSLHVYFRYWINVTHTSQSIQQSVEKRILYRILHAWRGQANSQRHLRNLHGHFRHRMETRILQNAFQTLRWRADYCAGLQDTMVAVVKDKERATLKAVITVWRDRLDNILAARFYVHLLTVRTARQWHRFVVNRKIQRQTDADNLSKAVRHHGVSLCRKVFKSIKREVAVSMLAQKRRVRLCHKYARIWKTKVDYAVTARVVDRELTARRVWVRWRLEYTRRLAAQKVVRGEKLYIVGLVFKEWRKTHSKRFLFSATPASPNETYLRPVSYITQSSSSLSSSSPSSSPSPSLLPVSTSQKRSSLSGPSAAESSFGFRGGGGGRRKQN